MRVIVTGVVSLFLFGFFWVLGEVRDASIARETSGKHEIVIVSAINSIASGIARKLLEPRLHELLDSRSSQFDKDAKFLEDILTSAIADLFRYRDLTSDPRVNAAINTLELGNPYPAIGHFRRIRSAQLQRDRRAIARAELHLGALYMLVDATRGRLWLIAAVEDDRSVVSCLPCLNRIVDGEFVVAERPSTTQSGAAETTEAKPEPRPVPPPMRKDRDAKPSSPTPPKVATPAPPPQVASPPVAAPEPSASNETPAAKPIEEAPVPVTETATLPPQEPASPKAAAAEIKPLVRYEPEYPPQALRRKIEGYAVVEFTITRSGKTVSIRTIDSHPPAVFDKAAERAIRRWRYAEGVGPRAGVQVRFEFKLQ